MLSGTRHAQLPVESQTGAWASRCRSRRASSSRQIVGGNLTELEAAFAGTAAATTSRPSCGPSTTTADADEASLPDELMADIRNGGVARGNGAKGDKSRSGLFHYVVGELKKRRWTLEQIRALLEKYPNGVAAKYQGRLADEIRRSYDKVER